MRAIRNLSRFVDRELHTDEIAFQQNVTNTGVFVLLSAIAEGVGTEDRNGLQVTMRSIAYKISITIGNNDGCLRVLTFIDKQSNGGFPTLDQLLETNVFGLASVNSPLEKDFLKRFRVVSDRRYVFTAVRFPVNCPPGVRRRLTHKIRYTGATNTIASITTGAVIMLMVASTAGGANSPNVDVAGRLLFAP